MQCEISYNDESSLNNHIEEVHSEEDNVVGISDIAHITSITDNKIAKESLMNKDTELKCLLCNRTVMKKQD